MPDTSTKPTQENLPPLMDIFNGSSDDAPSSDPAETQTPEPKTPEPQAPQSQGTTPQEPGKGGDPGQANPSGQPSGQQAGNETADSGPSLLDQIRSIGFADVDDEQSGIQRLLEAYQQRDEDYQAAQEAAEAARRQSELLLQHLSSQRNQSGQQPQANQDPQAKPQQTSWFKAPDVDDQIAKIYRDENGGWKPGTPHEIQVEHARREAAMGKFAEQLLSDPKSVLEPGIREVVKDALKEIMGVDPTELPSRLDLDGSQTVAAQANAIVDAITPLVYELDPVTRQPNMNRPNELGRQFGQAAMSIASQFGVPEDQALSDSRVIQATYAAMQYQFQQASQQRNGQQTPLAQQAPGANGQQLPPSNGQQPSGQAAPAAPVTPAAARDAARNDYRRRRARATSATGGHDAANDPESRPISSDIAAGQAFAAALSQEGF